MKIAIYPGSFDPITYGHIDIIERASKITDKLIVAVLNNGNKTSLFTAEERMEMIRENVGHVKNVEVEAFNGLLIDFAKIKGANFVIRGLRAVTDFEYELQMAQTNRQLLGDLDTIFLLTNLNYSYLSSSTVKEVAKFGGKVNKFVPQNVEERLKKIFN